MSNNVEKYIGLKFAYATSLAKKEGFTVRLVQQDGVTFIVTRDYKLDRINFSIKDDEVINATIG